MLEKAKTSKITLAALFIALALVLPFFTGQIPQIGKTLCPMHIPVMLAGFLCGPWYGLAVGIISPLLRFALFGMPVIMPTGIIMSVELASYGFVVGILYKMLPRSRSNVYVSLIVAMIIGRIIWGIMHVLFFQLGNYEFSWAMFIAGGFTNSIPGIILQIVIVPLVVLRARKI